MEPQEDLGEVTHLLRRASGGSKGASSELYLAVEQKLRQIAGKRLRQERPDAEMQETVLVNDAFLNLVDPDKPIEWANRKQFFALAAKSMRRALVDRARKRMAAKRGGPDAHQADVDVDRFFSADARDDDLVAVHEALDEFSGSEPRKAEFVEMRYFGGFTLDEIAKLHNVSTSLVKQDLAAARHCLRRILERGQ